MRQYRWHIVILWSFLLCSTALSQSVQVPKTYSKPVYMHYMPWFDTPQYGGSWGWHWTMANRNPDVIENGRRQIASHYYPLIGPYGSSDPDVVEYHLLLMKYAGIDGVLVDWYGSQGTNPDVGNLLNNSNALINRTDEAGLSFGLILEDRFSGTIAQAQANMAYARDNYFNRNNYFRYGTGNDPVVGVFGPITFQSASQWSTILSSAGEDVEFLPLWGESADAGSNADGEYVWVWEDENLDNYYSHMESFYQNNAPGLKTVMGVAYPGFHDYYQEGGGGSSYFDIPHNGTSTLNQTLGLINQYNAQVDILQLATWNDFGEGTIFEPTQEFGFSFLTTLQQFLGVPYGEYELQQIMRLYNLRKQFAGESGSQSQLDQAYNYFVALQVSEAVAVLNTVEGGDDPEPPAGNCSAVNINTTIQAENYCFMSGVDVEDTNDAGGGQNVGGIEAGDYMTYVLNIPTAGSYTIQYRVASQDGGGSIRLEEAGGAVAYGTVNVTSTGGWQIWSTISHEVNLPAGQHELAIVAATGGFNINWWIGNESSDDNGGSAYRIKNVWQNTYLYDAGAQVAYSASASNDAYLWTLESVSNGNIEIRNVGTGEYMHIENLTGTIQCTSRTAGWSSSRWAIEDVSNGRLRFRNVWQEDNYIHVENLTGYAQHGTINSSWQSAQWELEAVNYLARLGNNDLQNRTLNMSVYPNPVSDGLLLVDFAESLIENASLKLYDLTGVLLLEQVINDSHAEVDVTCLKPGIYILKTDFKSGHFTQQVVIE